MASGARARARPIDRWYEDAWALRRLPLFRVRVLIGYRNSKLKNEQKTSLLAPCLSARFVVHALHAMNEIESLDRDYLMRLANICMLLMFVCFDVIWNL